MLCKLHLTAGFYCKKGVDFIVFMERYLTRIEKNLVALGCESCSSSQEPENNSCITVY
jgi:hypothetical protein